MNSRVVAICLALALLLTYCANDTSKDIYGSTYRLGFGSEKIETPADGDLYIAGYHNGWLAEGIHDQQQVRAVWLGTNDNGIILVSVDCIGLSSDVVQQIKKAIDVPCATIFVCSTHDHAGIDTLGLWGPIGFDGKNPQFIDNLITAAKKATKEAYQSVTSGSLYYGTIETHDLQRDSRDPQVYDPVLYQLRFVPEDNGAPTRLLFYSAHAESLRGNNRIISRDFPGVIEDSIYEQTGENSMFFNGAIGGLVMTRELVEPFEAFENMNQTGTTLADYALACNNFKKLNPIISYASENVFVPLDNTLYMYYKFLGIIGNSIVKGSGETGYSVLTKMSALRLDDVTFVMIPGEIFPELYFSLIPEEGTWIPVGLADDEIGYVVNPQDFVLDEKLPYVDSAKGHYEETNSCGIKTFEVLSKAFNELYNKLTYTAF